MAKRKRSTIKHASRKLAIVAAIDDVTRALGVLRAQLLTEDALGGLALKLAPPPQAPDRGRSVVLCECTHSLEHHKDGPCTYGHGTAFGGCACPGWRPPGRRASKAGQVPRQETARVAQKPRPAQPVAPPAEIDARRMAPEATNGRMLVPQPSTAEKRLLQALAQADAPLHRRRLALWTGYSPDSGGYGQALADLRSDGYIVGSSDAISITKEGRVAAGHVEPLPTGHALLNWWLSKRPKGDSDILLALAHGRSMSRDDIASATGKSATSGGFGQALANLRRLGLIDGPTAAIRIASELTG